MKSLILPIAIIAIIAILVGAAWFVVSRGKPVPTTNIKATLPICKLLFDTSKGGPPKLVKTLVGKEELPTGTTASFNSSTGEVTLRNNSNVDYAIQVGRNAECVMLSKVEAARVIEILAGKSAQFTLKKGEYFTFITKN